MLTAQQGVAVITALFVQAEATRNAIASGWYFHASERDAALGAVRMIEDTQIAVQRDTLDDVLNGVRSEDDWTAGALRAEQALRDVKGIAAEATIRTALADTAKATAVDVAEGAGQVAQVAGSVAAEALSLTWTALPTAGKVAVVAIAVGVVVYFAGRAVDVANFAKGAA